MLTLKSLLPLAFDSAEETRQISRKTLVALEARFYAKFQRLIDRSLPSMKVSEVREALESFRKRSIKTSRVQRKFQIYHEIPNDECQS
jgi:hypothetical protein